jgi:hypothetical protein
MLVSLIRECCRTFIDTYREYPLERCWHSPTPLVVALVVGVGDTGDDNAADGPAHLQGRCAC